MALLAASVAVGVGASRVNAAFTYDLRITGGPTAATNAGHTVTNPSAGDYSAQIWARVTGDTNQANDVMLAGYLNVFSTQVGGGLFSGAGTGVTSLAIAVPPWVGSASVSGIASDITSDNVQDWGSNDTSTDASPDGIKSAWTVWQNTGGFVPGTTIAGQSQQVNANTWEVLIANLTIHVANVGSTGETDINLGIPGTAGVFSFATGAQGVGKHKPVNYTPDGASVTAANNGLTAGTGIAFVVVPEPASLGVLALGALSLVARRRRAK